MKDKYQKTMMLCVFVSVFLHFSAILSLHKHLLAFSLVGKYAPLNKEERRSEIIDRLSEEETLIITFDNSLIKEADITTSSKKLIPAESSTFFLPQSLKKTVLTEEKIPFDKNYLSTVSLPLLGQEKELIKNYKPKPSHMEMEKKLSFCKAERPLNIKKSSMNNLIKTLKEKTEKIINSPEEVSFLTKKHESFFENPLLKVVPFRIENRDKGEFKGCSLSYLSNDKEHKAIVSTYLKKIAFKNQKIDSDENKAPPFLPFLPNIPSLKDLNTISCGGDFAIDLEYIPRDDDKGYVFALTLIPKADREFERIKQNFYFLIDKSNSIQNKRYTSARQAVVSSICAMNKSDNFDVYTFDNKIDRLFEKAKLPTHEYLTATKKFLLSQKLGTFFSSKNWVLPLGEMLNNPIKEDQINNIILISNGDELEKQKNCRVINKWSIANKGIQSLYVFALAGDKNLPILEFFASKNNGKLVTCQTVKAMRRNLVRLVRDLHYPVAKNVTISIYEKNKSGVFLYPPINKQTHLYYDQPYVIMGTAKSLDDFVIFIQGKNPKSWFNIKKEISFAGARKGGDYLSEKWAQVRANKYYDYYLNDGEVENLKRAEKILSPHKITPAFKK